MLVFRRFPIVIVTMHDHLDGGALVVAKRVVIVVGDMNGHRRTDQPALDERRDREDRGPSESDLAKSGAHDPADSASGPRTRQSNTSRCPLRPDLYGRRRAAYGQLPATWL